MQKKARVKMKWMIMDLHGLFWSGVNQAFVGADDADAFNSKEDAVKEAVKNYLPIYYVGRFPVD